MSQSDFARNVLFPMDTHTQPLHYYKKMKKERRRKKATP